jgi:chorismate lyase/3-hydroxybenzoate synthase
MLHVNHVSRNAPQLRHTLAEFHFGTEVTPDSNPFSIPVALAQLGNDQRVERWSTDAPVVAGTNRDLRFVHDGDHLFASLVLPAERSIDIEHVTRSGYLHLDHLLRTLGYPHWLRAWNYFPDITGGEGEAERYRRFNAGRYAAVGLRSGTGHLPAASAMGTDTGGFVLCCLAGKRGAAQIENPRQTSAFAYPAKFGLRSPLFARATLLANGPGAQLLVSGTASIVGSESLHVGDPLRQLEETARNFEALVETAQQAEGGRLRATTVRLESLKVYLRNGTDYERLLPNVRRLFPADEKPLMLRADMCRPELLIEIEGTYDLE